MNTSTIPTLDFKTPAREDMVTKTMQSLKDNGFLPEFAATSEDALSKVKAMIPIGASVMNGASETLREIGYLDYLKSGKHGWNNLHEAILAESDKTKQSALRKQAVLSDFYLGSAHAVTESGEIVVASNTGSQLPHLVFTSPNIILVVGTQKIVPTLSDAFRRIDEYIVPLEDVRMRKVYGVGTLHAKTVILHRENPMMGRKVHVIFVADKLGF